MFRQVLAMFTNMQFIFPKYASGLDIKLRSK